MVFDKTGVSEEFVLIVIPVHHYKVNPRYLSHDIAYITDADSR